MLTKSNTMKIERKTKNKSLIKTSMITTRNPIKKKQRLNQKNRKMKFINYYLKIVIQFHQKKI